MTENGPAPGLSFASVSRAMWRRALEKSVEPAALKAALARETEDGLSLATLYTRGDWPAGRSGVPGHMPFTRGRLAADAARAAWNVRAVVDHPLLAEAKPALKAERQGGAGSIALRLDVTPAEQLAARAQEGPWGLRLHALSDLETLLGETEAPPPSLALDAGALALPAGLALIAFARKRGVSLSAELNLDPLAALAATGALKGGIDNALATLSALARFSTALGMNVSAVGVDTRVYHMAGASEAQEIALALATGAQYLRALEAAGLALEEAVHQFRFVFAVDSRFFRSLTKLRAFRLCWARLLEACGVHEDLRGAGMWAETSFRDLSRRDPHVNMLRGVAGCFAAALGGADTIAVRPFDEAQDVPSLFARRMARNTGLVLAEEGGLSRVLDAAGGSWALEVHDRSVCGKSLDALSGVGKKRRHGASARFGQSRRADRRGRERARAESCHARAAAHRRHQFSRSQRRRARVGDDRLVRARPRREGAQAPRAPGDCRAAHEARRQGPHGGRDRRALGWRELRERG